MQSPETRDILKRTARRLFALRGVDGVSVRDIVRTADLKNSGSLHYYFRTKEALVRELIVDGAKLIDERRHAMLDRLEGAGGPATLRRVLEILVYPSTELEGEGEEGSYNRFVLMLQLNHRRLFMEALDGRWNSAYARCLDHIRAFLSELSPRVVNQRLVFLGLYLSATISAREGALAAGPSEFWGPAATLEHLIDTMEGLLEQPAGGGPTRRAPPPRRLSAARPAGRAKA